VKRDINDLMSRFLFLEKIWIWIFFGRV